MNMTRNRIRIMVPALLASTVVGFTASQASAATPRCTASRNFVLDKNRPIEVSIPATSGGVVVCQLSRATAHGYTSYTATMKIQLALSECQGYSLNTDGLFGPATESALKSFQSNHGLTADGIYGPQTAKKLSWMTIVDNGYGANGCANVASLIK